MGGSEGGKVGEREGEKEGKRERGRGGKEGEKEGKRERGRERNNSTQLISPSVISYAVEYLESRPLLPPTHIYFSLTLS